LIVGLERRRQVSGLRLRVNERIQQRVIPGIELEPILQHGHRAVGLPGLTQRLRQPRAGVVLAGKLLEEGFQDLIPPRLVAGAKSFLRLKLQQVLARQARLELLDLRDDALLNSLVYAQAQTGNLAAALQADDQYRAVRPNDPNPWDDRGDILFESNHDDEAAEAYRGAIAAKPDFVQYQDYLKLALVYADEKKFALADSVLQDYTQRVSGAAKLYVPLYEAQFQETRGDLEGARASRERAVRDLGQAGQTPGADEALQSLATISILTGEGMASALAFARQQKLSGRENGAIALLQAAQGDAAGSDRSLQLYAAARSELGPRGVELVRNFISLGAALARQDAPGLLAAAGRLPNSMHAAFRYPRGWAYFQTKDYSRAEQDLRSAIFEENDLGSPASVAGRSPLRAALAHFYLGQVYEATGKHEQAANEYQEFLSHFDHSTAKLPQIALARAALQRSLP